MAYYNVNKIENLYNDFSSIKRKFKNNYLNGYNSSYIKKGNNDVTNSINRVLESHYNKISRIYDRIDKYWSEFLNDVKNTDLCIAGQARAGSVKASGVSSLLSSLPNLQEYSADLGLRIKSISGGIGTAKVVGWSEDRTVEENLSSILESCAATISTAFVSLSEGLVKLCEDAVDLLAITGAAISSIGTGIVDLSNMVSAKISGDESLKTDYTKQIWDETRSFVSTDYTESMFDKFYENTSAGRWMKENAYAYDMVRSIGAEVGEVVGVTLLSIVTGGSAAVIYGGAKVAEHTEENWQDENTSTFGGLLKGGLQGTADGLFFALGAKGDATMKAAATKAVEQGTKQGFKKGLILLGKTGFECGCSIAQDGSSIVLDALFSNDSIVDENGNTISFNSFKDKLNYYYKQAGGLEGLVTSMLTAGALSFMSDASDLAKVKPLSNSADLAKVKPSSNADIKSQKLRLDDLRYDKRSKTYAIDYLKSNFRKFSYTDTNLVDGVNDSIRNNGLLHFTTDDAADKILNSGYIKKTGALNSYGSPKSYFFSDIPSVGQFATNIDDVPIRTTAVKVVPPDNVISSKKLKIRSLDDGAISYDGNFSLSDSKSVSKEYFCIFKENDELVYKQVPKDFYDKYPSTPEGKSLAEFLSNKRNVEAIKADYLSDLSSKFNGKKISSSSKKANIQGMKFDTNNSTNVDSLKREYAELISWKSSDKFKRDEAYWRTYGDKIGGNPYKKNMDRLSELETILSDDVIKSNSNVNLKNVDAIDLSEKVYTPTASYSNRISLNNMNCVEINNAFSKMDIVMKKMEAKYPGESVIRLKEYLKSGDIRLITSSDGCRNFVDSFDTDFVSYYLKNRYNIDISSNSANIKNVQRQPLKNPTHESSSTKLHNFFKNSGNSLDSTYGSDQGGISKLCKYYLGGKEYSYKKAMQIVNEAKKNGQPLPRFSKSSSLEYDYLKKKIVSKGFTDTQASVILSSINDLGACSYIGKENTIFYKFANNPSFFEKKFGFSMYKIDSSGKKVLNSNELLLDLYLFANDTANGGKLFSKNYDNTYNILNSDTRIDVLGRYILDTKNQVFLSDTKGSNNDVLSKYMKSKGLKWDSYNILLNNPGKAISDIEFNSYIDAINSEIGRGKIAQLNIFRYGEKINMYSTNPKSYGNHSSLDFSSGHAVSITGMDSEGFFVSSWGREYKILFNDLKSGGHFNIMIDDIAF